MRAVWAIRNRKVIMAMFVASLVLGGLFLQMMESGVAQSGGTSPAPRYAIDQATISREGYRLTSLPVQRTQSDTWHVTGTASGGGYRLLGAAAREWRTSGCCCTYLPCMLNNHSP